jgi:Cys-rich protein (TIGR01571 family)
MNPRQQSGRQHQRFSWQNPSPPVDVTPAAQAASYPQPQQQAPRNRPYHQYQQHQQPVPENDPNINRALSYAQTPIEYRGYAPSSMEPPLPTSPPTPIDPRPQSIFNPQSLSSQPQRPPSYSYLSAEYPHEKEPPSPLSPQDSTHPVPFSPVSPMIGIPKVPTQQPSQHNQQRSNLSPINTNVGQYSIPPMPPTIHSRQIETASALPSKTPIQPISPGPTKTNPADYQLPLSLPTQTSYATEPYSPHGLTSQTHHGAVFSPNSAHGPNGLDFTLHQPGQIAHPNMDLSGKGTSHEWKHSLCECGDLSTCFTGLFCPCILYGRTSYRLSQRSAKKDPTDMLSYKTANTHCVVMGAACGLWGLFPMLQRTRLRHMYKLKGSVCGDALKGCCCCCCTAIQNEREMKDREESSRRFAGPSDVYKKTEAMTYAPQR